MKPTFIGIGAQKCASTWIYSVLKDHPEVVVSKKKEIDFFSYYYDHGIQWYENQFQSDKNTIVKAIGEISPSYLYHPQAPERIYRYNPKIKLIITLREPIARAYSNHLHEIRVDRFKSDELSFENGLKNNPMYLEQSLYAKHLELWYQYFPKDNILVLFQEEIKNSSMAQVTRLYKFLGIDKSHIPSLDKEVNKSYIPKLRWLNKTTIWGSNYLRKVRLGWIITCVRATGLMKLIHSVNRQKPSTVIPAMKAETEQMLIEYLQQDVNHLKQLLERKVLPWTRWN
ncbi:hypothetical protein PN36_04315 [Candidatus Thiomargarita nelsonii]|uniref:Sulfotransferase domain-containing protein n=1 Tax=Candidatus Thiomargarita nelsonii TaxID=1003181 RepID=A0A0A6P6P1_9GAMM|nr:hypothetical protein PN36_04315 [Candidatus Thiomargarita nelsonii]